MQVAMPIFNTHRYVSTLKAAGIPEPHAEAQAQALAAAFDEQTQTLATQADIADVRGGIRLAVTELRGEMKLVESRMDRKLDRLDGKLDKMQAELQGQIIHLKWMFSPIALGAVLWVAREFMN